MSRVRRVLDDAIDTTAESFLKQPANYSDERSLAEDVRSRMCSVLTPASVDTVSVEESSKAQGPITDHEAYTDRYRDTDEIDRASCENGIALHQHPAGADVHRARPAVAALKVQQPRRSTGNRVRVRYPTRHRQGVCLGIPRAVGNR